NDIIIAGSFSWLYVSFDQLEKITLKNSGPATTADIFVAKYDAAGNLLWVQSAGAGLASGLITDSNGDIYMAGMFGEEEVSFDKTILKNSTSSGSSDVFIAKLSGIPTSVRQNTPVASNISSNPTESTFHISGIEGENCIITIYSLTGEKIYESFLKDSEIIDLSGKAKGTYLYQLLKEGVVLKTGKIVLE
ncbi:MAG TPA: T9SS type A sorting domain-containing protein, partial [Patescibacteria group bacterium]|nr:T9SS type A sorting domain-containing protein [Patescibacteria group bacterium]